MDMQRTFLALAAAVALSSSSIALAHDEKADKPDCTEKQKAVDDAKTAVKDLAKPDLASCKEMKGKEKSECEKPIKDKAKEDKKAAQDKVKEVQKTLGCCKNPKGKGCTA